MNFKILIGLILIMPYWTLLVFLTYGTRYTRHCYNYFISGKPQGTEMPDFLNLPHLRTLSHEDYGDHYRILAKGMEEPKFCAACSHPDFYGHGSQRQSYMDTPMHGKRILIEIDRRRFRCKSCGKTTFEPLPDMDSKRQATSRLIRYIEKRCMKETFVALSREVGLDDKTIRFIFDDYIAKKQQSVRISTPEVLGIDEIKIIGDYRATLTNVGRLTLFDLLHSRKKLTLLEYFDALPDKCNVQVLVMDLWNVYRQVGKNIFPGKLMVADKFHVVRMANDGLERVRRRIRKTVDQRTRLKLKNDRFILLKRANTLSKEQAKKASEWFSLFPELFSAYVAKERFFDIYAQSSRGNAELAAKKWDESLDPLIAKEFRDLRVALRNWWEEIFNYLNQ